jgi:hypothetical protein
MLALDLRVGKESTDAGNQVALVARGLHAQQIMFEQTFEDLPPPGQLLKNIRRGKRDVHEKGEDSSRPLAANLPAHVHQLIVLYPDHVAGSRSLERDGRELPIDP